MNKKSQELKKVKKEEEIEKKRDKEYQFYPTL